MRTKIEYYHASKFGNGAMVADEFRKTMALKGINVDVHHVKESRPKVLPPADLYVFSSPGRMGKPIKEMRRFLTKLQIPPGTQYAIIVTEMNPEADNQNYTNPDLEELGRCQMVAPIMTDILKEKGMNKVLEGKIFVTGLKGPLERDWRNKVNRLAESIASHSKGAYDLKFTFNENKIQEVRKHE